LGTRINGDVNCSADLDMSDAVYLLNFLFLSTAGPPCPLEDPPELVAQVAQLEVDLEAANAERDSLQVQLTQVQEDLAACVWLATPAGFTFVETNAEGYREYTHDASGIRFVRLPGGSFDMGSPATETGRRDREGPVHTVSLSPFLIAKYEVTQAEYASVMTAPPADLSPTPSTNFGSAPASDQRPVEEVSWDDLHLDDGFLERTGLVLPSEAQWEYACRAGTSGPYAGNGVLDDMGWYGGNSGGSSHNVGTKQANDFGLHDMHGNVFEWCRDVYDTAFYGKPEASLPNPLATAGSGNRVARGGNFGSFARSARSAHRFFDNPSYRSFGLGFRPARPLP
jgi:formylglycine-generating enzyme required for sulfatase activity